MGKVRRNDGLVLGFFVVGLVRWGFYLILLAIYLVLTEMRLWL